MKRGGVIAKIKFLKCKQGCQCGLEGGGHS